MFARFRLGVTWVLLAAEGLLGGGVPAGAQGPVGPPDAPDAYALLALSKMHVSGSISLLTGSLGVNEKEGALEVDGGGPRTVEHRGRRDRFPQGGSGHAFRVYRCRVLRRHNDGRLVRDVWGRAEAGPPRR